jgi:hypothetical protein
MHHADAMNCHAPEAITEVICEKERKPDDVTVCHLHDSSEWMAGLSRLVSGLSRQRQAHSPV